MMKPQMKPPKLKHRTIAVEEPPLTGQYKTTCIVGGSGVGLGPKTSFIPGLGKHESFLP